jgi:hypothetical protein
VTTIERGDNTTTGKRNRRTAKKKKRVDFDKSRNEVFADHHSAMEKYKALTWYLHDELQRIKAMRNKT